MTKRFFLLVFIIICIMTFMQCKKCPKANNLGNIKFSQAELNLIPYTGAEKPVFIDSAGFSIKYDYSGYRRLNNSIYHEWNYGQNDCEPDYYYIDRDETSFLNQNYNTNLSITLQIYPFSTPIKKRIWFFIAFEDSVKWEFNCYFEFESSEIREPNPNPKGFIVSLNDSLKVGQTMYHNVYVLTQTQEPDEGKNLKTIYYTTINGVVGFKNDSGHLWYLKE